MSEMAEGCSSEVPPSSGPMAAITRPCRVTRALGIASDARPHDPRRTQ
jgi:hypothetical protein